MTTPSTPFSLADLDQPRSFPLDPQTLELNLTALEVHNPDLVSQLRTTQIPPAWRSVKGLDGWPTWDIDGQWWTNSAAPHARAESVAQLAGPDHALALSGIGTGAELARLSLRVGPLQPIYVFESNRIALRAVLSTVDLSNGLRDLRIILLTADDVRTELHTLLETHPGLLPPVRMVSLPDDPPERLTQLREVCEPVAREILATRKQTLEQLQSQPPQAADAIAFAALSPDPRGHVIGQALQQAATAAGWSSCLLRADQPASGHMLGPARQLTETAPRYVVALAPLLPDLPLPQGTEVVHWLRDGAAVPPDGILAAASPEMSATLAQQAPDRKRVDLWVATEVPGQAPQHTPGDTITVFGDRPELDANRLGITQPTHRMLWDALQNLAGTALTSGRLPAASVLLQQAEKSVGFQLDLPALRDRLQQIIARNLIPALVLETICRVLEESGIPWNCVGRGHERSPTLASRRVSASWAEISEQQWNACPLAVVIANPSAHGDVLRAAGQGWPLALAQLDRRRPPLPTELLPTDCYQPLPLDELAATFTALPNQRTELTQQSVRTATLVRMQHTWNKRIETLRAQLAAD